MLRSKRQGGKCAKFHIVAATNNRDLTPRSLFVYAIRSVQSLVSPEINTPRSLHYCLFTPHIHGCCSSRTSRTWWITHSTQRHRRGCNNIPFFLQRIPPIARSFCKVCTWHDRHILVTAPCCCDRKAQAESAQSFTLWQQATIEITCRDHS